MLLNIYITIQFIKFLELIYLYVTVHDEDIDDKLFPMPKRCRLLFRFQTNTAEPIKTNGNGKNVTNETETLI